MGLELTPKNREVVTHQMKLQPEPFKQIKLGTKDIEIRLFDEKRQQIRIGDYVEFTKMADPEEKLRVKVLDLIRRPNFLDLFNDFEMSRFGAEGYIPEQLVSVMRKYYSQEEETKYGALGIVVSPVPNE